MLSECGEIVINCFMVYAGFGQGGGGRGTQTGRQRFRIGAQGVGAATAGVGHDGDQGVLRREPLPEQIPQGDERTPRAPIETALGFELRVAQAAQPHETGEELEQLRGRVGAGLGRCEKSLHPRVLYMDSKSTS